MVINIAVLAVVLEAGSAAVYFYKHHELFYMRSVEPASTTTKVATPELASQYQLHPYFGFVLRPGISFTPGFKQGMGKVRANNYGFNSPYDYPFRRTSPNQFLIGVFGGSVASNVALYEGKTRSRAFRTISGLAGKDVVVLNFGSGAYKQPQQLLVLNYFLAIGQQFDLVINIDGFNEVGLSHVSDNAGLDPSMPNAEQMLPLAKWASRDLSAESIESLASIYGTRAKLNRVATRLKDCRTASSYLVNSTWEKILQRQYDDERLRFEHSALRPSPADNLIVFLKTRHTSDLDKDIVQLWSNSSILMNGELAARGIPYLHFLQPNQYCLTERVFPDVERRVAISENSPYRDGILRTYPALRASGAALRRQGVRFVDSAAIFDGQIAPMYCDDCCHYTDQGAEIFAQHIAREVSLDAIARGHS